MRKLPKFSIVLLIFLIVANFLLLGFYLGWFSGFDLDSLFKREPKPGSCLVLEEKYCKLAGLIDDPWQRGGLLATYKVPKKAILFSPIDGFYSSTPVFFFKNKETNEIIKYPGATITVSKDNFPEKIVTFYSFIYFDEEKRLRPQRIIKKGEPLGVLSDKQIDFLGDYNLVIRITKQKHLEGNSVSDSDNAQLKEILNIK